jgi:hypothetical protein
VLTSADPGPTFSFLLSVLPLSERAHGLWYVIPLTCFVLNQYLIHHHQALYRDYYGRWLYLETGDEKLLEFAHTK